MATNDVINQADFVADPEETTLAERAAARFRDNASSVSSTGRSIVTGATNGQPGAVLVLLMLVMLMMSLGTNGTMLVLVVGMALMFII